MTTDLAPIETFADWYAHFLFFHPRSEEAVQRLGVEPARFFAARDHWQGVMAKDVADERNDRLQSFGLVFARTRKRLKAERPEIESLGPLPAAPEPEPAAQEEPAPLENAAAEPESATPIAAVQEPPQALPSYMQLASAVASASLPSPVAPAVAAPSDPDATGMVDNRAVLEGLRNKGLPFDLGAEPRAPVPLPLPGEQSGETAELDVRDVRAVLAARGIKIGGADEPVAESQVPASEPAPTPVGAPMSAADQSGETLQMDVREVRAKLAARGVAVGPDLPPLERFAEIQVALARFPDAAAVLARFGLSPQAWSVIVQKQTQVLRTDAEVRARYEALLAHLTAGEGGRGR